MFLPGDTPGKSASIVLPFALFEKGARGRAGQAGPWPGGTSRPLACGKGGGLHPGQAAFLPTARAEVPFLQLGGNTPICMENPHCLRAWRRGGVVCSRDSLRGRLPPHPPGGGSAPWPPERGKVSPLPPSYGPGGPGRTSRPVAGQDRPLSCLRQGRKGCTPGRPLSCLRQERKFRSCSWAGTRRCEEMTHRSARLTAGRSCPFLKLVAGEASPAPPGRGLCPLPSPLRGALPPGTPERGEVSPLPPSYGPGGPGGTGRPLACGKSGKPHTVAGRKHANVRP